MDIEFYIEEINLDIIKKKKEKNQLFKLIFFFL